MRPSVSLVVIAKNEINNIQRWYDSVSGCFDEYIFCDTGSTDGTVEKAKELGLKVVHFTWVDDFAAARNAAFSHATCDYVMWTDLDDELSDKAAFNVWRDNIMQLADYWIATYHYAFANNKPACSFIRERCWKRSLNLPWRYFVHEGVPPVAADGRHIKVDFVRTWAMNHRRTLEDLLKDKGRNLGLFNKNIAKGIQLDARMRYYYGKELFEAGLNPEAAVELAKAAADPMLEIHDRTLAIQYAISAFMNLQQWDRAIEIARIGMQLDPQRAEFWVMAGDAYAKKGEIINAIPYFSAARMCVNKAQQPNGFAGLIFTQADAYGPYPTNNLARCLVHIGKINEAEKELHLAREKFPDNEETKALLAELTKLKDAAFAFKNATPCDDIVFTCLGGLYEWDSDLLETKGFGGSETACILMARHLKKLSGRNVKVFNVRQSGKICKDGVEYLPHTAITDYMGKNKPYLHIAWRHNMKMTDAKTYLWSHDLFTPGAEDTKTYEKYLCLSEFHKSYVSGLHNIPADKILVTRNGIDSSLFGEINKNKNPYKVVFSSSPDRGLDKAIRVLDKVREVFPVELFVFYGFDNMRKMNLLDQVRYFEDLIKERPWIKMVGNISKADLLKHYQDAALWVYPTDFLETSCINALELEACGVYPIVRKWGALPNTLAGLEADVVDRECLTETDYDHYANRVIDAIKEKKWEKIAIDPKQYDWENIAKQWLEVLP